MLTALSKSPNRANAVKADNFLRQMELSVEAGGSDVEPDRLSYALAILTCARCADDEVLGTRAAERILEKMEARAGAEAERRRRLSSAAPPAVCLDVECFNVVLLALSKSRRQRDAPDRAIRIIRRMEQHAAAEAGGDESVRPNIRSWNGTSPAPRRVLPRAGRAFSHHPSGLLTRVVVLVSSPHCFRMQLFFMHLRGLRDPGMTEATLDRRSAF